jgi:protein CpxP
MKKLLMVCCLLASMVSLSKAQGRMRMAPADRAKQMQTQLKLTDDQTAKITAIYTAQSTKMDSVMKAGGDRSTMRPLMQATNEKVAALLTDDQKTAWKKIQDEQRASRGNGNGGGGGTPPPPQK